MAVCSKCGKKGLFLKLNSNKLCPKCAALPATKAIESEPTFTEDFVCNYFIEKLVELGWNKSSFRIEHPSEDYSSLFYDLSCILRVKATNSTKWLSIPLTSEDKDKYKDSPLFERQIDKNQYFWKSYINDTNRLSFYVDLVSKIETSNIYGTRYTLTDKEYSICDYIIDMFVSCGANKDNFYLYALKSEFEIIYYSSYARIRIKSYAKRPGGYIIDNRFDEYKVKHDNFKYNFIELSELYELSKCYIPELIKKGESWAGENDMSHYIKYNKKD